ncbi:hypothetical protein AAHZ94_04120 [Streptomyces sp. HSW2009]|uniref:hypothetical protein n=1 Tax=Streptomyces sp. HSW2009 TaxID=3142890 RepID=UPI0032ED0519
MADAAIAPYAQVTAAVNADGTVVRSQNVTEVKKVGSGEYRITVSENVRLDRAVPIATLNRSANWDGEIFVTTTSTSATDHTFQVITGNDKKASGQPFHAIVP